MNIDYRLINLIPHDIIKFILVVSFSLVIGLEQRRHFVKEEFESRFGTDRTLTLIGILGFILYIISPQSLIPFLSGGFVISTLLAIYYFQKIKVFKKFGATSLIIVLITYCLAPLLYTQPKWLVLLIVVVVLVLTEIKKTLFKFSKKIENDEFISLAKFLVIAGVVLPLLPDEPISDIINFSPYRFWLAIVAVSGISYFSYLLKKFVFPQSGIILTGILGGLYSSTATTIILAKKSKDIADTNGVSAAIILATTMMYLRIFLLALFFNKSIAIQLIPSFATLIILSTLMAFYFIKFKKKESKLLDEVSSLQSSKNPLEFKTALVFAALFIFFAIATSWIKENYGSEGINILSFIVGVTDIDPFIINLFQGNWEINSLILVTATLNATSSNNLLKMLYGVALCDKPTRLPLIVTFSILFIIGLLFSFVIYS